MTHEVETAPFDEALQTERSLAFAKSLFARFPWMREHAKVERTVGSTSWGLVIVAPAPSGDTRSTVVVWDDAGDDPSIGFGAWHAHEQLMSCASVDAGRIELLDTLAGVFADRYVLLEELGGEPRPFDALIDLANENALLDELTEKYSTGRVRLRSWSGALDREWTIADLERGERPRPR
jgi:hypothetical protein